MGRGRYGLRGRSQRGDDAAGGRVRAPGVENLARGSGGLLGGRVNKGGYFGNSLGLLGAAGIVFAQDSAVQKEADKLEHPGRALEESRIGVFERAAPAVVLLEVEVRQDWPEGEGESEGDAPGRRGPVPGDGGARRLLRSEGSGFVVRADGVIVTNQHVVAGARQITVRFLDNSRLPGRLVGVDERSDVAVLRVEARDLRVLEFGDSDRVRIGQSVYAIGAPFGQEWSFTAGMLSGKNRTRLLGPASPVPLYEDYLQTDAFVNAGNSGGPLLDREAKVVGMNTLIARADRGVAFAVPSNFLKSAVAQILESGSVVRPWFGFRVETLGESSGLHQRLAAAESGAVVLSVEPQSPAMHSDIRPADVVKSVDGRRVHSSVDLQRELFVKVPGRSVQLSVWRMGTLKNVSVVPRPLSDAYGHRPGVSEGAAEPPSKEVHFGLALKDQKGAGVRVESVESGSAAARADFQSGDVILEVEGRGVKGGADCLAAIGAALKKNRGGALVQVDRHGRRVLILVSVR